MMSFEDDARAVFAGCDMSFLVSRCDSVWSMGNGMHGRHGLGGFEHHYLPHCVESIVGRQVIITTTAAAAATTTTTTTTTTIITATITNTTSGHHDCMWLGARSPPL